MEKTKVEFVRRSPLTGKINSMVMDVYMEDVKIFDSPSRPPIQDIFPYLTSYEREFIIGGYTKEDWDCIFGGLEDDEE